MAEPRTMREAVAAQVLQEVDALVSRVETLPNKVSEVDTQLKATTDALTQAADAFRMAVTAFSEQAKVDLTEHMERKAHAITTKMVEEQHASMREAARAAFRSQVSDKAESLASTLKSAAAEFNRARWARMLENGVVALLAATIAAALVYGYLR